MTLEEAVVQMRKLPPERQWEVLDLGEFLEGRTQRVTALARMLSASEGAVVEDYIAELGRMRLADQKRM